MKTAILVDHPYFESLGGDAREVFLFGIEGGSTVTMRKDMVSRESSLNTVLWLVARGIDTLYTDDIDDAARTLLLKSGVVVRPLEELKYDVFLRNLLIDSVTGMAKMLLWCYFYSGKTVAAQEDAGLSPR